MELAKGAISYTNKEQYSPVDIKLLTGECPGKLVLCGPGEELLNNPPGLASCGFKGELATSPPGLGCGIGLGLMLA